MAKRSKAIETQEEKLDLILWLIELTERRRESTSNRSATVVSADALLLAGIAFLLPLLQSYASAFRLMLLLGISITLACVVASIILASMAIASVWKIEGKFNGNPVRPFFDPFATTINFSDFRSFENAFDELSDLQIGADALSELWTAEHLLSKRYHNLQWALRLIEIAAVSFFVSAAIVLFQSIR